MSSTEANTDRASTTATVNEDAAVPNVPKTDSKCDQALLRVVTRNERIHKLLDSIEALGCPLPADFFACR
jgi:hypothetical protein